MQGKHARIVLAIDASSGNSVTAHYLHADRGGFAGAGPLLCTGTHSVPLRPNSEPKLDSPYTSSVLTLIKRLILP